jgi:beta-lactamase regulating signal transducer with metallopeptidase domain
MSSLFASILNMSLTASYVALIVMLIRLVLRKVRAPLIFSYALWLPVLIRLVFPFSFEGPLSLIPGHFVPGYFQAASHPAAQSESAGISEKGVSDMDRGAVAAGDAVSSVPTLIRTAEPVSSAPSALDLAAFIWVLGMALLLLHTLLTYSKLKRGIRFSTLVKDRMFESDRIATPFVLGLFKPKIYIPTGLTAREQHIILLHEQVHIQRLDYIIKPLAFAVLIIHWFNPVVWLSYFLMIKDMEMSCDEKVMSKSGDDLRADYAKTLLAVASRQSGLFSPLSFGESNVTPRVKNILNFRRPVFWMTAVTTVIIAALTVILLMNPADRNAGPIIDMGDPAVSDDADKEAVIQLVEQFGNKLRFVSLTASKNEVSKLMHEHYGEYVTQELIDSWLEDQENAPGRLTSNPYPERIDISSVEKTSEDEYTVNGRIMEVAFNNIAATRPILLKVTRTGERWLIRHAELGPYEPADHVITGKVTGHYTVYFDGLIPFWDMPAGVPIHNFILEVNGGGLFEVEPHDFERYDIGHTVSIRFFYTDFALYGEVAHISDDMVVVNQPGIPVYKAYAVTGDGYTAFD